MQISVPQMGEVDGAIESPLDLDAGIGQVVTAGRWFKLVDDSFEADGVVLGDVSGVLGAEDGGQSKFRMDRSPGGRGVFRRFAEARCVSRDELVIQIAGGSFAGMDSVAYEFGYESSLEGAVDSFTTSSCLGAMGEGQSDGQGFHGDLKGGGRDLSALFGGQMVGADELASAVEIESPGQAEAGEDLIADLEATIPVLLRLELAPERLACGVVGAEQ